MPWPMRFGPAAQDDDLLPVRRSRLVGGRAGERRRIGRVHIGGGRGELGGAGVDALEHRPHAERAPRRSNFGLAMPAEHGEPGIGETHSLEAAQRARRGRQAFRLDLDLGLDDAADLGEKPGIDLACRMDHLVAHAEPHRLRQLQQAIGRWCAERRADGVPVVALAEPFDGHLVEPGEAGFQRAQRLLQALLEGAADRHGLADRFHRRGEDRGRRREISRTRSAESW